MFYKGYAHAFREIREGKGLTLSYFEKIGISKSSLSKFENGKSRIKLETLDAALQEMNVSLAEYEYFLNHFESNYQENLSRDIEAATFDCDIKKLEAIYKEAKETGDLLTAYSAKSCFEKLTVDEREIVIDFLYDVKQWGYLELSIFYFTLPSLSEREMLHLIRELFPQTEQFCRIHKFRRRISQIFYRAAAMLSAKGNRKEAYKLLHNNKFQAKESDLFIRNLQKLALGFYCYCFEEEKEGKQHIDQAIAIFDELGSKNLGSYYRSYFERLLEICPKPYGYHNKK